MEPVVKRFEVVSPNIDVQGQIWASALMLVMMLSHVSAQEGRHVVTSYLLVAFSSILVPSNLGQIIISPPLLPFDS